MPQARLPAERVFFTEGLVIAASLGLPKLKEGQVDRALAIQVGPVDPQPVNKLVRVADEPNSNTCQRRHKVISAAGRGLTGD